MTFSTSRTLDELADSYVAGRCEMDPIYATALGVPGLDDRMTDYSPEASAERAELDRRALRALGEMPVGSERERQAARMMSERLESQLAFFEAGEHLRSLRNIASPTQAIRSAFDLMPRATVEHWEIIGRRMREVPSALESLRLSLEAGMDSGLMASRRQALEAARQAKQWAGENKRGGPAGLSFFEELVAGAVPEPPGDAHLAAYLDESALRAASAYGQFSRWLREDYAPAAPTTDAVGEDRYRLWVRHFLGMDLDLAETYRWGWEELARIEDEMTTAAGEVAARGSIAEVIEYLESESDLAITGEDAFREWLQEVMDSTIADLDGRHFDIPGPVRRIEARIAPPGGAAAMYYTGPSEDFTRPGRAWYPTRGRNRFPLWGELSIAYHEGVPGHHLQIGQVRWLRDDLNRFQRAATVAGHAEGWALYAERLMDELGYFTDPRYRLGMLRAQALRAVRVIVDIGMHLGLRIPDDADFNPGQPWSPELGQEFLNERSRFPVDFMASEVVRYLGWPAQAISYKVGERVWLDCRQAATRAAGADFDLKAFHSHALNLGPMGLDQLRGELG